MIIQPTHLITIHPSSLDGGYNFQCPLRNCTPESILDMLELYESQVCGLEIEVVNRYQPVFFEKDGTGWSFIVRTTGLGPKLSDNFLICGTVQSLTR